MTRKEYDRHYLNIMNKYISVRNELAALKEKTVKNDEYVLRDLPEAVNMELIKKDE